MPRRSALTPAQLAAFVALPATAVEIARQYTLDARDLARIRRRLGAHNRLGFAVQLCYLRYPGQAMDPETVPPAAVLAFVAQQVGVPSASWGEYARRDETRREHARELQAAFGYRPFTVTEYRRCCGVLMALALQTNKAVVLAQALLEALRADRIIVPAARVIDRCCAEALARGTRLLYRRLTAGLAADQYRQLDRLLQPRAETRMLLLTWLRQPPGAAKARNILTHLARLQAMRSIGLPADGDRAVQQRRLTQLAREGAQMSVQHLRDLEDTRRYATLVAVLLDTQATVIDQVLDMHDRVIGKLFTDAKRKHTEAFQRQGRAINEQVRLYSRVGHALIEARQTGADPFAAIERVVPWAIFTQRIAEAAQLAQPAAFDHLPRIADGYRQVRRYAPRLLDSVGFNAASAAQRVLDGINTLKAMNQANARSVPHDAPTSFVKPRWTHQVFAADGGIDRQFSELCALAERKNALRAGDMWVPGSRQFKDFAAYLLPQARFAALSAEGELPVAITPAGDGYRRERLTLLTAKLREGDQLAAAGALPDAAITDALLQVKPLAKSVPAAAERLEEEVYGLVPHRKITELLLEVDRWTDFTRHFTHLRAGTPAKDRALLLTVILADASNLGLTKMAEACPGATVSRLDTLRAWHIRDETYAQGLAELVNTQHRAPFAAHWGTGTTASSDGQHYKVGGRGEHTGQVKLRYGTEPGVTFYTHISDQYAPFHTTVIAATVRDATQVLDGLLYHESDVRIAEHYTDTNGFTDHVFALCHRLGFRFAPRLRDLKDKNLYVPEHPKAYPALTSLIGERLNAKLILAQWPEILRPAASIKQGTVTASLMLRKLARYPRQNGLALALRELGRIERTLFTLDWLLDPALRQQVTAGLNKGEAKNTLARAVCFNRLGAIRDHTYDQQRHRASGLNLVVAAIILWNTVYLERAVGALREQGQDIDQALLKHVAPVHWGHINLTGDYTWRQNKRVEKGGFRPLRPTSRA